MHEILVNRLGGLSLPRKSVVRLIDRPNITIDVYREIKQQNNNNYQNHWRLRQTFGNALRQYGHNLRSSALFPK